MIMISLAPAGKLRDATWPLAGSHQRNLFSIFKFLSHCGFIESKGLNFTAIRSVWTAMEWQLQKQCQVTTLTPNTFIGSFNVILNPLSRIFL